MDAEDQPPITENGKPAHLLTSLTKEQRTFAMERFAVLRGSGHACTVGRDWEMRGRPS
jgi:hypothetical protein